MKKCIGHLMEIIEQILVKKRRMGQNHALFVLIDQQLPWNPIAGLDGIKYDENKVSKIALREKWRKNE